jgi:BirA family biotin operon repressor/biotin-[acetyl-CoA-carboxylase] ligase
MNGKIIRLSVVDSTNIYTTRLISQSGIDEWTVVVADLQTGGRGQRGKTWNSEMGKNLLCSIVLKPKNFVAKDQFQISMMTSLAIIETLNEYGVKAKVKWPNDILVKSKKIAGILIENQIVANSIESCVIGIGLNLNQQDFNNYEWPATSLFALNNKEVDIDAFLNQLLVKMKLNYLKMNEQANSLRMNYISQMFFVNQKVDFKFNNQILCGTLLGVDENGAVLLNVGGELKCFVNGEVRLQRTSF